MRVLLLIFAFAANSHADTIGINTKNPGNIISKCVSCWRGAIGRDPWGHLVFKDAKYGLYAIKTNLKAYKKRGIKTPFAVVSRWMPYNPKNAEHRDYLKKVCRASGFSALEEIDLWDEGTLYRLTKGIVYGENGKDPYTKEYGYAFRVDKLEGASHAGND